MNEVGIVVPVIGINPYRLIAWNVGGTSWRVKLAKLSKSTIESRTCWLFVALASKKAHSVHMNHFVGAYSGHTVAVWTSLVAFITKAFFWACATLSIVEKIVTPRTRSSSWFWRKTLVFCKKSRPHWRGIKTNCIMRYNSNFAQKQSIWLLWTEDWS